MARKNHINLDKENKRIGFTIVGEHQPSSDEELDWIILGTKILEIVDKFRNKNAGLQDVVDLATLLTQDKQIFGENSPEIRLSHLYSKGYSILGEHAPSVFGGGIIYISIDFANDLIEGKASLTDLFCTVGHEMTHILQEQSIRNGIKNKDKKFKEVAEIILKDYDSEKLPPNIIGGVVHIMKNFLDDNYVKEFENMDKTTFEKRCHDISFSQYIQFSHEVDARRGGIIYTNDILTALSNHPHCTLKTREWLEARHNDLKKWIEIEKQNRENFKFFDDFKLHVEQLTGEHFKEIGERLDNVLYRSQEQQQFFDYFSKVYIEAMKISYKNKPFEFLMNDILLSLHDGSHEFCSYLLLCYQEIIDEDILSNNEKSLGDAIVDMLLYDDLPKSSFLTLEALLSTQILSDAQIIRLAKGAIKTKRFAIIRYFTKTSFFGVDEKTVALFEGKYLFDAYKTFLNNPTSLEDFNDLYNAIEEYRLGFNSSVEFFEDEIRQSKTEWDKTRMSRMANYYKKLENQCIEIKNMFDSIKGDVSRRFNKEKEIKQIEKIYGKRYHKNTHTYSNNDEKGLVLAEYGE